MGIGAILEKYIKKAGRSREDVARAAGVRPSTLGSFIDRDSGSSFLNLLLVARELGLTVEQLYEEAGALEAVPGESVQTITSLARHLDEPGKEAVLRTIRSEAHRMANVRTRKLPGDSEPEARDWKSLGGYGFSEASAQLVAMLRSRLWYLEVCVPGLYKGAVPGDVLVVARAAGLRTGDTGIYKWNGVCYVCILGTDTLDVQGPKSWTRSIHSPYEYLGKVIGVLHMSDTA